MARTMDFPDLKTCKDFDKANYQNYLAWQAQTNARRRESQTQFNLYQTRALERMHHQAQFKDEALQELEKTKDIVERRLSVACDCESCEYYNTKSRSNSDASATSSSPTPRGAGNSTSSFTAQTSVAGNPLGTTIKGATSPSSKNSLISSPPPRSRHHQRKCQSVSSFS